MWSEEQKELLATLAAKEELLGKALDNYQKATVQIEAMEKEHTENMATLAAEHDAAKAALKERDSMRLVTNNLIAELREKQEEDAASAKAIVDAMEREHADSIADLKAQVQSARAKLEEQKLSGGSAHADALKSSEVLMEAMKKEHANDMAKLAAELEASQADLKHKEEKH